MALNWDKLRVWNGSQNSAFEKLCCQLFGDEKPTADAVFIVKGSGGDAGVECYWKLANGSEHALQAKFFTSPPNSSQWSQIDDSVTTALDKHPHIRKYVIALPIDRSDARDDRANHTFMDKWDEHVSKWTKLASGKQMDVEFPYWGESEIFNRLATGMRGRHYFWFNSEAFDSAWFSAHLAQAKKMAGPRYTQALNVELPIAEIFEGMGRTERFFETFQSLHKELRLAFNHFSIQSASSYAPRNYPQFEHSITHIFEL